MEAKRRGRQRALCAICSEAIREGDGVRWVAPPGITEHRPAHLECYERDWEAILSGLEGFPLPLASASRSEG